MPIITPPTVIQNAMDELIGKVFTNQPQRDHAAKDLTGLMICPNKTAAMQPATLPLPFQGGDDV